MGQYADNAATELGIAVQATGEHVSLCIYYGEAGQWLEKLFHPDNARILGNALLEAADDAESII